MNWRPFDVVATVLAIGLVVALIATAVVPAFLGEPLSDTRAKLISTAVGAMIAILAGYMGSKGANNGDE